MDVKQRLAALRAEVPEVTPRDADEVAQRGCPRYGRQMTLPRDPDCAYCRSGASFPGFVDYEGFAMSAADVVDACMEISP